MFDSRFFDPEHDHGDEEGVAYHEWLMFHPHQDEAMRKTAAKAEPKTLRGLKARAAWHEREAARLKNEERKRRKQQKAAQNNATKLARKARAAGVKWKPGENYDQEGYYETTHAEQWKHEALDARDAANWHAAHAKIRRAQIKDIATRQRAAAKIQHAYRVASASPHTRLGRQRILRDGGFDPQNHPNIVLGRPRRAIT